MCWWKYLFFTKKTRDAIRSLSRYMMVGLSCYVLCEGMLQVATGVLTRSWRHTLGDVGIDIYALGYAGDSVFDY